ncbi:hypothetical protein RhiirA5_438215 [Rhizophagus irregularis]|uniref:Uncharacterized protein n=1 Tax=Rhizophagus irregularis TaxID=588596 RepID=A0A2N0NJE8_9GLOM|nr:hypothetical protein RhiirA5_438215 [Rhizophagus irregularis]
MGWDGIGDSPIPFNMGGKYSFERLFQRQRNLKQIPDSHIEAENEFWTPISKIKEAENLDSHIKVFPYEGKGIQKRILDSHIEGFGIPRFLKWERWTSLDEPTGRTSPYYYEIADHFTDEVPRFPPSSIYRVATSNGHPHGRTNE